VIEDAIRALEPQLGPPESEPVPLDGGITNRNYRVRFGGRDCVVRLPGKDTELLGIDRAAERAATMAAAAIGIGPDVLAFEPERGCLVTGFIDARPVPPEELRTRLAEVATALRAIHSGPSLPISFSPFERTARYAATALARGGTVPGIYDELRGYADRIAAVLHGAPVPCHNDLLTANFLDDGTRLRILDWEYAGMGDRFFDLANLAVNNDFGPAADERLLQAYFEGAVDAGRRAALPLMKVMSDLREAMWNVVQTALSDLDEDFAGAADRLFARAEAAVADPAHAVHLEEARAAAA
jgi:thiamine kinase-like enzyme